MFISKSSDNLRDLPPAKDSLILHVMRSAYRGGWIWGNTSAEITLPSVEEWGWQRLYIKWTSIEGSNLDFILETCKCRTLSCKACKYTKKKLKCISLCGCKR